LPDCRIVVLHAPAAQDENDPLMLRFRRILDTLQEGLEGSAVVVALENRNQQPGEPLGVLDHPEALAAFSRQHGCRIVLDTAHASTLPVRLLETYAIVRDLLANIHLSDVQPAGWWGRFSYPRSIFAHHRLPGQGILPLHPLLQSLASDGYEGLITLELSPVALRFWRPSSAAEILRQSLKACRSWIGL
jgi:sugar phosphate isomerase/epimerase